MQRLCQELRTAVVCEAEERDADALRGLSAGEVEDDIVLTGCRSTEGKSVVIRQPRRSEEEFPCVSMFQPKLSLV